MILEPDIGDHGRPLLRWRFDAPVLAISTAVLGGGTGLRDWVLNVEVDLTYERTDPEVHLAQIAAANGLDPTRGVGLLTAAPVRRYLGATVAGVEAVATTGLSHPIHAADPNGAADGVARPGTINVVAWVPVPLAAGALVNTLVTMTEAKAQALADAGYRATGTASDAVVVCCPPSSAAAEPFGGPRSPWGHRLALAVHSVVHAGAMAWRDT